MAESAAVRSPDARPPAVRGLLDELRRRHPAASPHEAAAGAPESGPADPHTDGLDLSDAEPAGGALRTLAAYLARIAREAGASAAHLVVETKAGKTLRFVGRTKTERGAATGAEDGRDDDKAVSLRLRERDGGSAERAEAELACAAPTDAAETPVVAASGEGARAMTALVDLAPDVLRDASEVATGRAVMDAFDLLSIGLVIVARSRTVVFANASARATLEAAKDFGTREKALHFCDRDAEGWLRDAVDAACAASGPARRSRFHADPAIGDVHVTVAALDHGGLAGAPIADLDAGADTRAGATGAQAERSTLAAVFLSRLIVDDTPNADMMCDLYGLTAREAKVAAAVGAGMHVDEIGDRCGLKKNTVNSYLKLVRQKMGVSKVTDIVRAYCVGPAQLAEPRSSRTPKKRAYRARLSEAIEALF
ncbi:MAG: LuxR C-terminal-related transcriptional regulator [Pseudomonadota bacterium]